MPCGIQAMIWGLVVEQIYSHFNEFKLLLCCSAGTKYAWFLHDIVVMGSRRRWPTWRKRRSMASR